MDRTSPRLRSGALGIEPRLEAGRDFSRRSTAIEKNAAIADAHAALRSAQTQHGRSAECATRLAFLHQRLDATRASTVRRRTRALALARALDKCAVDYEARAALGAPPPAVGIEDEYPRLVDRDDVGPADDDVSSSGDDEGAEPYDAHLSNIECVKMWNSKMR